eukprot:759570-Hanusia_phi.AAC.7
MGDRRGAEGREGEKGRREDGKEGGEDCTCRETWQRKEDKTDGVPGGAEVEWLLLLYSPCAVQAQLLPSVCEGWEQESQQERFSDTGLTFRVVVFVGGCSVVAGSG